MQKNTGKKILIYSSSLSSFEFGPDHPFKPDRAARMMELLNRYSLIYENNQEIIDPEPIEEDLLKLFHSKKYLNLLKKSSEGIFDLEMLEAGIGNPDNPVIIGIYDFFRKAAGGTHHGAMMLLNNEADFVFNPHGGFHHAGKNYAEGFCYINDIAITIQDLVNKGQKVAYIDIDVHHGNGVQDAFYSTDRVLTISIHETGKTLYPWGGYENETGIKMGEGYNINIPLLEGTDDDVYLYAFESLIPEAVKKFNPDILLAEIGGDVHMEDPLAHLSLTSNGYKKAISIIRGLCPKILATGGGGYNLYKTSALWTIAWAEFCQIKPFDNFAGSVGGMMYGPETKSGQLEDPPFALKGEIREKCMQESKRIVRYVQKNILPLIK